ncbi:MAG TPA: DNA polymerase III subunit alpha [Nitrospinae bacterium]|nr:DNA polymerase III subunit alpha [Nitrospinota bacterium]
MHHSDFVHLHLHTQYSLLDGAIRLDSLLKKASEYKMPSIAMTDHGNMFGAVDFYQTAKKYGIKPIIGCEVYVAPKSRLEKSTQEGISDSSYHLILLAKNTTGYKNLVTLVSAGYLEGFYYRPRIDKEILAKHTEGLIALSSCMKGEVQRLILKGQEDEAYKSASFYKEVMGERKFYLEIQDQGIPEQKDINKTIIEMAKRLSIPLVATNDCHYMDKSDAEAHEVLLCIQTGKTVNDPKHMKFTTDQFYFKSPEEMKLLFKEVPEAISNTLEIADRCNLEIRFDQIHLPRYDIPSDSTLDGYLRDMTTHGLEKRLKKQVSVVSGQWSEEDIRKVYYDRLESELKIIKAMGYSGYFLIVWDFIDYARRSGIPVGPGRGSAAGSLVAYALRITDLDPIKYGLLFERFLNPDRVSMPDIDIDFCKERRDEVIDYVTKKYGNVAQIITFGSMNAKAVIRDVGRALAVPYGDVDKIAKLVPNKLNITLDEAIKEEPRFTEMGKKDETIGRILNIAKKLEGLPRHASTHAAGIVISPSPLTEFMPLYKGNRGEITTQYPMGDIEKLGLLKMDILGIRNLTVIRDTEELVREKYKIDFNIENIPLNDVDTYRLLGEAQTFGVFQLESSGIRDILRKMKPEVFEDIIALVALYRPGPLGSGMVDDFIKRKHGTIPIKNIVPQLDEILKETYGVILYQEQVMKIASALGGFSMGAADSLRRAMGKKKPEEMAQQREKFIKGSVANKIAENKAEKIFDLMEHFAGYGFNKSHSAAYAMIAYQTAYLKAHYPLEFMASLLTSEMGNTDKVILYIAECKDMGILVLPPDINESFKDFTVVYDAPQKNKSQITVEGGIRFGLAAVKNVGVNAVESILKEREKKGRFDSLSDFCENIELRVVNRKVIESLIKCGAFDSVDFANLPPGKFRARMINNIDIIMGGAQNIQKDREKGQFNIWDFGAPTVVGRGISDLGIRTPNYELKTPNPEIEWTEKELLSFEKEALGFYISGHPLSRFEKEVKHFTNSNTQNLQEIKNGREISIAGIISKYRTQVTKKGDKMAFVTLEDLNGSAEVIVFPDVFKASGNLIEGEEPVLIKGNISAEEDSTKIIAREIFPLTNIGERFSSNVHINLKAVGLEKDMLIRLKEILSSSKGKNALYLHLFFPDKSQINIGVDKKFQVSTTESMVKEIENLFGDEAVYFE